MEMQKQKIFFFLQNKKIYIYLIYRDINPDMYKYKGSRIKKNFFKIEKNFFFKIKNQLKKIY